MLLVAYLHVRVECKEREREYVCRVRVQVCVYECVCMSVCERARECV